DPLGLMIAWTCSKKKSNVENAFGHWQKHRGEFPDLQNAKKYVEHALDFAQKPPAKALQKTRSNGDIVTYDPGTNTLAVSTSTGSVRTMFRPDPAEHGY